MKALFLFAFSIASGSVALAGDPKITWHNAPLKLEALPEKLSDPARAAALRWAEYAGAHELRMDFDESGALLVIGPDRRGSGYERIKLVDRARVEFEKLVPAWEGPLHGAEVKDKEPEPKEPEGEDGEIPEDPEGDFPWLEDQPEEEARAITSTSWGDMRYPPDTDCGVLFALGNQEQLDALLDSLAAENEWMATWAEAAKKDAGFVVGAPLVGAFLLGAPDLEEWDPKNELVHRAARLLLLRRFGILPPWLDYGVAWNVENEIQRTIRCYPNRKGFVYAVESTGWENDLKQRFSDYHDLPLEIEAFTGWPRGKWDYDRARVAFGLVGFLAKYRAEGLGKFYLKLRNSWLQDNRVVLGGETWERDRDFEVAAKDQGKWLLQELGDDTLVEAARALRLGKDYRPPKKRRGRKR